MKEIEFKGKVAVVTGAASGMGLKTSQEFARLGATVVMCDLDEARLRQEVSRLRSCEVEKCGGMAIACVGDASFITGTNHVVDGGRLCMYRPYVPPSA